MIATNCRPVRLSIKFLPRVTTFFDRKIRKCGERIPWEIEMNSSRQKREEAIRYQLTQRSDNLLLDDNPDALGMAIRDFFPDLTRAFVINWMPDQDEDIYWVLIDPMGIAQVEILRGEDAKFYPPKLQMIELVAYKNKQHSRDVRERLAMALELIKSFPRF